jgi:hypothetical protein
MDPHILIAVVGALVYMGLSTAMPCMLNNQQQPFLKEVKSVFITNRQTIVISSLIVAITIYLALKITPSIVDSLDRLSDDDDVGFRNLARLNTGRNSGELPAELMQIFNVR